MQYHGFCPLCGRSMSQDRFATGSAICECGWADPGPTEQVVKKMEKNTAGIMAVIYVLIIALFGHFMNWGAYSVSGPLLKVGSLIGTNDKADYEKLAQICIALDKFDCAKNSYRKIYASLGDVSGAAMLAKLHTRLGDLNAASEMYSVYFRNGGKDGEVQLDYAKVLELKNEPQEALKYYDASIATRPDVLPVQATSGIVRIHVKHGQYEEAFERIVTFHESAENAKGYLNTELAQMEQALGPVKSKEVAKRAARKAKEVAAN